MPETVEEMNAEFDAFEPSDDSIDNDERLQILVDRWDDTPDKEGALAAMMNIIERNPETTTLGEPGPLVHAIEQIAGYEDALAASLETTPSYYGVWMVNRILSSNLAPEVRTAYLDILRKIADLEDAPWSVRSTAKEFLAFQEG